jgi:predicted MFS family arabinose efflux permease
LLVLPLTVRRRLSGSLSDPVIRAICALGVGQIISWGTTLYALGVLGKSLAADTGWSLGLIYGGLTTALLVSSAVSTTIGRVIDTRGGRQVMATGAILAAAGLALVASATSPVVYLAGWALTGLAMRMCLYDAAFAAIVQVSAARGRRSISYITLFGGFASTVFWPIGFWLEGLYGWRATFLVFAAINAGIAAPLYAFGLSQHDAVSANAAAAAPGQEPSGAHLAGSAKQYAMWLFALIMAGNAAVFGALAAHLLPLIAAMGVGAKEAVTLAALKGVAQVAGRVADIVYGKSLHPVTLGRIAVAILPVSLAVLLLGGMNFLTALAFTIILGVSNGLITIVRGAVPLSLFGPKGYGAVLGLLATPYLLLNAIAPMAFALLVDRYGYQTGAVTLLVLALMSMTAMERLGRWYRRLAPAAS